MLEIRLALGWRVSIEDVRSFVAYIEGEGEEDAIPVGIPKDDRVWADEVRAAMQAFRHREAEETVRDGLLQRDVLPATELGDVASSRVDPPAPPVLESSELERLCPKCGVTFVAEFSSAGEHDLPLVFR